MNGSQQTRQINRIGFLSICLLDKNFDVGILWQIMQVSRKMQIRV